VTSLFGQSWLTAHGLTGGLLLASAALLFVGVMMFTARVFLHAPFGARPGYYQWERGLIVSGHLTLALGLTGLTSLLRQAGDLVLSDVGLTAFVVGAAVLTVAEVSWLTKAGLPDELTGALIRIFVILAFLSQAAYGAALLQTGLLPGWLGWITVVWNIGWLVVLVRAKDPYYPVLHFQLPVLAGILLLMSR
jgi:hypothetical protein